MFILNSRSVQSNAPIEYIPCGAISVKVGDALTVASGNAAKATGTTVPTHVSVTEKVVGTAGELIGAIRIEDGMTFEIMMTPDVTNLVIGKKHTLNSTGDSITSTTTDGVAEIVSNEAVPDARRVVVRFK